MHLLAFANLLMRPILLLDGGGTAGAAGDRLRNEPQRGLYLPLRHDRQTVMRASAGQPLVVAWSSAAHNHYVTIVPHPRPSRELARLLPLADINRKKVAKPEPLLPHQVCVCGLID